MGIQLPLFSQNDGVALLKGLMSAWEARALTLTQVHGVVNKLQQYQFYALEEHQAVFRYLVQAPHANRFDTISIPLQKPLITTETKLLFSGAPMVKYLDAQYEKSVFDGYSFHSVHNFDNAKILWKGIRLGTASGYQLCKMQSGKYLVKMGIAQGKMVNSIPPLGKWQNGMLRVFPKASMSARGLFIHTLNMADKSYEIPEHTDGTLKMIGEPWLNE